MQVREEPGGEWRTVQLSSAIKALVVLNLQASPKSRQAAFVCCISHEQARMHVCRSSRAHVHVVRHRPHLQAELCSLPQSYAGGRDLWGLADTANDTRKGWRQPIFNDGLFEVGLWPCLHRGGADFARAGSGHAVRSADGSGALTSTHTRCSWQESALQQSRLSACLRETSLAC